MKDDSNEAAAEIDKVDAVIVGAGVVGCALAQRLASRGYSPVVLEAGPRIGEGVTSRNSGVVHAAIYYPPGSIKAKSCLRGKVLLKEWCQKKNVPMLTTGKWIIAQPDEVASLETIFNNAQACGATGLVRKAEAAIQNELPGILAKEAIFSAETGIVDAYSFTASLLSDAVDHGAMVLVNCAVSSIERLASGSYRVQTNRGPIETDRVFNAAGLYSDEIANMVDGRRYKIYPWRGDYFRIRKPVPIRTLVYPARKKNAPGLGVHLTLNLDGSCKLGPDAKTVESKDDFAPPHANSREAFWQAARIYLQGLELNDLEYDTCGIRPKLRSPNDTQELDFVVAEDLPGFINLVGIESPGLTAAMALAELAAP